MYQTKKTPLCKIFQTDNYYTNEMYQTKNIKNHPRVNDSKQKNYYVNKIYQINKKLGGLYEMFENLRTMFAFTTIENAIYWEKG